MACHRNHAWSAPQTRLLVLVVSLYVWFAGAADDVEELAVEQVRQEAILEKKFWHLRKTIGVEDPRTQDAFFKIFDLWIQLYRLNKADDALRDIVPAASKRKDNFYIKAIQALAFTRWKQSRFREALARFHEMEGLMGKNAALCENIGHTYNSLGEYVEAERYFEDSLSFIREMPEGTDHNEGGILLGLANIKERRGELENGLPLAKQALEFYQKRDKRRGWESSLSAKASMQVSKMNMKLGELKEAEKYTKEAIRLFNLTAGEDSPLTASAYQRLGEILWARGKAKGARKALHRAYELEGIKDAMDLVTILEIHNLLVETHLKSNKGLDRKAFRAYFQVVQAVAHRVRNEMVQDGNAGAYYKTAGELLVLGDDCQEGTKLLTEAVELIQKEKNVDVTGLLGQCKDLLSYCAGTYGKEQAQNSDEL